MSISLEEAKSMMSPESLEHLRNNVRVVPAVSMDGKMNNDILMQALCRAVTDDVIHLSSLDERIVKLLNATTNSLSQNKLGEILTTIRQSQPNMVCVVSLMSQDMSETISEWVFTGPNVNFNRMFGYVLNKFNITPAMIRTKMTEQLKPTIVNNIAQLVSRFGNSTDEERDKNIKVSINTITRLVNMVGYLLFAEFKEI